MAADGSIWAPWRMEYILAKKEKGPCIFCTYATANEAERRANYVLCRGDNAYVVLNRFPFAAGHLLVVPLRHAASFGGLSADENDALFRLAREATQRLSAAVSPEGVNMGMNLGTAAGAGIAEHMHVHIVPRWVGDTNFMPVVADVRVMPEHLAATFERLRPHFADLDVEEARAACR